jgi:hypothetical protein
MDDASMDDGRSWRQRDDGDVDERVRKAIENDTPLHLRIDDSDALDFESYKNSLFEDPFDFHTSTLPPSSPGGSSSNTEAPSTTRSSSSSASLRVGPGRGRESNMALNTVSTSPMVMIGSRIEAPQRSAYSALRLL